MPRGLRWLLLALALVVLAAGAGAVLLVQPGLADARDAVDARWRLLREPLQARYEALAQVPQAFEAAGEADRAVARDLSRALDRWRELISSTHTGTDFAAEAATADELEALARRARANIAGSDKLKPNKALAGAFSAFDQAVVVAPIVKDYNRAVADYERKRSGTIEHLVASVLGDERRPRLLLG